jgi:hypothetical protein
MPNIWVILIIINSSLIKGITGFGFTLLLVIPPVIFLEYAFDQIGRLAHRADWRIEKK